MGSSAVGEMLILNMTWPSLYYNNLIMSTVMEKLWCVCRKYRRWLQLYLKQCCKTCALEGEEVENKLV